MKRAILCISQGILGQELSVSKIGSNIPLELVKIGFTLEDVMMTKNERKREKKNPPSPLHSRVSLGIVTTAF